LAEGIVSAARTGLGDTLRSVVYFTPSAFDVVYLRGDLYESSEAARDVKARLVDFETMGFAESPVRSALAAESGPLGIGDYEFTVRFHRDGFVVRILEGDHGVLLTTDSMNVEEFETAAATISTLLLESSP
jgi:hypothetical protein